MKALFSYPGRFYKSDDGSILSNDANQQYFERYLNAFDEIIVITRVFNLNNCSVNVKKTNIINHPKISFFALPETASLKWMLYGRYKIIPELDKLLDNVDALIVRMPNGIGTTLINIAEKKGVPWAVEVVGCAWDALWNHSIKGKILAPISYLKNKRCIAKSKYALYVTDEFLQKRYPCNGYTVACSDVDISFVDDKIIEKRIQRIESIKAPPVNFGMIGNLEVKYKGHETAMKALSLLSDKKIDFRLKCLGAGDKTRLSKAAEEVGIKDKVEFCGTLPRGNAVMEWLDEIDVFLIPSYTEGLPRALVEAMSRGCPCVGTTAGGIPELLSDKVVVKPKDHKELANVIYELVSNIELLKEQARSNFKKSKEYTSDILHNRRNKFWNEFWRYALHIKNKTD